MDRHREVGESYNIGARCERTNLRVVERNCDLLDQLAPGGKSAPRLISDLSTRIGLG